MFVEIPPDFLKEIASGNDRIPKLYYYPLAIARKFFWKRLKYVSKYIINNVDLKINCLDFGCGSGVFLPTLSKIFTYVDAIDVETKEAEQIIKYYSLPNVSLFNKDINEADFGMCKYDVITAMDVLEHFNDLRNPCEQIFKWLKSDGLLFASLPTENIFTKLTRIIGGYKKPDDHYYSASEVEDFLSKNGFIKVREITIARLFPLYSISVWGKKIEKN